MRFLINNNGTLLAELMSNAEDKRMHDVISSCKVTNSNPASKTELSTPKRATRLGFIEFSRIRINIPCYDYSIYDLTGAVSRLRTTKLTTRTFGIRRN